MSTPAIRPQQVRTTMRTSPRSALVRALVSLLVTALAAIGLSQLPALSAHAAGVEDHAVTSISIVDDEGNPVTEAVVFRGVHVDAAWTASSTAQPGDFFTISWPVTMLQGAPDPSFEIFDAADPDSGAVATCSVTNDSLTCVYTDYVAQHDNVSGTVNFSAQLRAITDEIVLTSNGSVEFRVGINVVAPPEDGYVPPESIAKFGDTDYGTTDVYWQFEINPAAFVGVPVLKVEDVYDMSNTFVDGSLQLNWRITGQPDWVELVYGTDYTADFFPDEHRFTIDIVNTDARQTGAYVARYHTDVPADAERGDVFSNALTVSGESLSAEMEWTLSAGGNGSGSTYGTFGIVKAFADEASAAAGLGEAFTGTWTCALPVTGEVVAGTWDVTGGGSSTLTQTTQNTRFPHLPLGTLCSAAEEQTPQGWAAGVTSAPVTISRTPATLTVTNALRTPQTGQLLIHKVLVDDAGLVVAPQVYSGTYTCSDGTTTTTPAPWSVEAGGTFTSGQIPEGLVCSVVEDTPASIADATWAAPQISADVTISADSTPEVTVTNVLTPADPSPTPTDPAPAPTTEAPGVTPTGPTPEAGDGALAQSGAQVTTAVGAAVLLAALGALLVRRSHLSSRDS